MRTPGTPSIHNKNALPILFSFVKCEAQCSSHCNSHSTDVVLGSPIADLPLSMPRCAAAKICVVVVFGVTGSGKSRIGAALAKSLRWTFYDADDFHGEKNRAKLQRGIPLTDRDRLPWLNRLRRIIKRCLADRHSMVLACSALKRMYRQHLRIADSVIFVYLKVNPALVKRRLQLRRGHFMNVNLLQSQFATLEAPTGDAIVANATRKPRDIVNGLRKRLLAQGYRPGPKDIVYASWS